MKKQLSITGGIILIIVLGFIAGIQKVWPTFVSDVVTFGLAVFMGFIALLMSFGAWVAKVVMWFGNLFS